mgnify:CR=1 FL=1
MRALCIVAIGAGVAFAAPAVAQAQGEAKPRLNPVVELLEQKKPIFGLYAPSNRRQGAGRGGQGAAAAAPPPAPAEPPKTPAQLAADALAHSPADYIFDGSMEGDFERAYPNFVEFVKGMAAGGALQTSPSLRLRSPPTPSWPQNASRGS